MENAKRRTENGERKMSVRMYDNDEVLRILRLKAEKQQHRA